MAQKKLSLVRHGKTLSNAGKIYAGRSPEPLTEDGAGEAEELGRKLRHLPVGAVYSSPVRRAVQTAEIIAAPQGLPVTIEPSLTEILLGPWKGLSEDQVEKEYPEEYAMWQTSPSQVKIADRETLKEVQARAIDAIGRILAGGEKGEILAVTHVAVIRCLTLHFHGRDLDDYKKIAVPNLSIHTLKFDGNSVGDFTSMEGVR
jgi:broad specificity phosphatase PhoE